MLAEIPEELLFEILEQCIPDIALATNNDQGSSLSDVALVNSRFSRVSRLISRHRFWGEFYDADQILHQQILGVGPAIPPQIQERMAIHLVNVREIKTRVDWLDIGRFSQLFPSLQIVRCWCPLIELPQRIPVSSIRGEHYQGPLFRRCNLDDIIEGEHDEEIERGIQEIIPVTTQPTTWQLHYIFMLDCAPLMDIDHQEPWIGYPNRASPYILVGSYLCHI